MTKAQSKAGHAMPSFLERVEKGRYRVRGTEIVIVQQEKGWKVEGTGEVAFPETFASRHAATEKLEQRGLIPADQPKQPEPKATDATEGKQPEPAKRPTTRRKPQAKAAAKV